MPMAPPKRVPPGLRYFELRNESTNTSKFWAIQFIPSETRPGGAALLVWWGRIGTKGQNREPYEFTSDDAAQRDAEARVTKKLSEGYRIATIPTSWEPPFMVSAVDRSKVAAIEALRQQTVEGGLETRAATAIQRTYKTVDKRTGIDWAAPQPAEVGLWKEVNQSISTRFQEEWKEWNSARRGRDPVMEFARGSGPTKRVERTRETVTVAVIATRRKIDFED